MKRPTIEQLLIATIDTTMYDEYFVARVMQALPPRSEILSNSLRIESDHQQKKGSFMSKFRALPVPLAVVIIAAAIAFIGGTTYAAYTYLWKPVHINVGQQTDGADGHTRTMVALQNCTNVPQEKMVIETKLNTSLSPEAIKRHLQAQCEFNAIEAYMSGLPKLDNRNEGYIVEPCVTTMPTHITDTITPPECTGVVPAHTVAIDNKTLYIKDGIQVTAKDIKAGTTIYVVSHGYTGKSGLIDSYKAQSIIAVSLPIEDYTSLGASIAYRSECLNNPSETCLSHVASNMVFYRTDLPASARVAEYEGRISSLNGDTIVFLTSSNRSIEVTLPAGTVANYAANSVNNTALAVGDMIQINAIVTADKNKTSFQPAEVSDVSLVIDIDEKTGAVSKY